MRIECPRCAARYEVAERLIGPAGKSVRCAKCGMVWVAGRAPVAEPEPPPQWPEPPQRPAVPPPPASSEPPEHPALGELRAAQSPTGKIEQASRPPRPRSLMPVAILGWAATALLLGAAAWAAYAHREAVIEAWPPSEHVYLALGLRP